MLYYVLLGYTNIFTYLPQTCFSADILLAVCNQIPLSALRSVMVVVSAVSSVSSGALLSLHLR